MEISYISLDPLDEEFFEPEPGIFQDSENESRRRAARASADGLRATVRKGTVALASALFLSLGPIGAASAEPLGESRTRFVQPLAELSERYFNYLATNDPFRLASIINSGSLKNSQLTFAAEALGHATDRMVVITTLTALLRHPSAIVREGAIYGLQSHLSSEVHEQLRILADSDPSAGVRAAAIETLDF